MTYQVDDLVYKTKNGTFRKLIVPKWAHFQLHKFLQMIQCIFNGAQSMKEVKPCIRLEAYFE